MMGLSVKIPEPPEALVLTLQVNRTGLPLVRGALMDQPHIWMMEHKICLDTKAIYDSIMAGMAKGVER